MPRKASKKLKKQQSILKKELKKARKREKKQEKSDALKAQKAGLIDGPSSSSVVSSSMISQRSSDHQSLAASAYSANDSAPRSPHDWAILNPAFSILEEMHSDHNIECQDCSCGRVHWLAPVLTIHLHQCGISDLICFSWLTKKLAVLMDGFISEMRTLRLPLMIVDVYLGGNNSLTKRGLFHLFNESPLISDAVYICYLSLNGLDFAFDFSGRSASNNRSQFFTQLFHGSLFVPRSISMRNCKVGSISWFNFVELLLQSVSNRNDLLLQGQSPISRLDLTPASHRDGSPKQPSINNLPQCVCPTPLTYLLPILRGYSTLESNPLISDEVRSFDYRLSHSIDAVPSAKDPSELPTDYLFTPMSIFLDTMHSRFQNGIILAKHSRSMQSPGSKLTKSSSLIICRGSVNFESESLKECTDCRCAMANKIVSDVFKEANKSGLSDVRIMDKVMRNLDRLIEDRTSSKEAARLGALGMTDWTRLLLEQMVREKRTVSVADPTGSSSQSSLSSASKWDDSQSSALLNKLPIAQVFQGARATEVCGKRNRYTDDRCVKVKEVVSDPGWSDRLRTQKQAALKKIAQRKIIEPQDSGSFVFGVPSKPDVKPMTSELTESDSNGDEARKEEGVKKEDDSPSLVDSEGNDDDESEYDQFQPDQEKQPQSTGEDPIPPVQIHESDVTLGFPINDDPQLFEQDTKDDDNGDLNVSAAVVSSIECKMNDTVNESTHSWSHIKDEELKMDHLISEIQSMVKEGGTLGTGIIGESSFYCETSLKSGETMDSNPTSFFPVSVAPVSADASSAIPIGNDEEGHSERTDEENYAMLQRVMARVSESMKEKRTGKGQIEFEGGSDDSSVVLNNMDELQRWLSENPPSFRSGYSKAASLGSSSNNTLFLVVDPSALPLLFDNISKEKEEEKKDSEVSKDDMIVDEELSKVDDSTLFEQEDFSEEVRMKDEMIAEGNDDVSIVEDVVSIDDSVFWDDCFVCWLLSESDSPDSNHQDSLDVDFFSVCPTKVLSKLVTMAAEMTSNFSDCFHSQSLVFRTLFISHFLNAVNWDSLRKTDSELMNVKIQSLLKELNVHWIWSQCDSSFDEKRIKECSQMIGDYGLNDVPALMLDQGLVDELVAYAMELSSRNMNLHKFVNEDILSKYPTILFSEHIIDNDGDNGGDTSADPSSSDIHIKSEKPPCSLLSDIYRYVFAAIRKAQMPRTLEKWTKFVAGVFKSNGCVPQSTIEWLAKSMLDYSNDPFLYEILDKDHRSSMMMMSMNTSKDSSSSSLSSQPQSLARLRLLFWNKLLLFRTFVRLKPEHHSEMSLDSRLWHNFILQLNNANLSKFMQVPRSLITYRLPIPVVSEQRSKNTLTKTINTCIDDVISLALSGFQSVRMNEEESLKQLSLDICESVLIHWNNQSEMRSSVIQRLKNDDFIGMNNNNKSEIIKDESSEIKADEHPIIKEKEGHISEDMNIEVSPFLARITQGKKTGKKKSRNDHNHNNNNNDGSTLVVFALMPLEMDDSDDINDNHNPSAQVCQSEAYRKSVDRRVFVDGSWQSHLKSDHYSGIIFANHLSACLLNKETVTRWDVILALHKALNQRSFKFIICIEDPCLIRLCFANRVPHLRLSEWIDHSISASIHQSSSVPLSFDLIQNERIRQLQQLYKQQQ